jgi:hypothetical protein
MSWEELWIFLNNYILDLFFTDFGRRCLLVIAAVISLEIILSVMPKSGTLITFSRYVVIMVFGFVAYEFGFKYLVYGVRPVIATTIFLLVVYSVNLSRFAVYPAKKTAPPK